MAVSYVDTENPPATGTVTVPIPDWEAGLVQSASATPVSATEGRVDMVLTTAAAGEYAGKAQSFRDTTVRNTCTSADTPFKVFPKIDYVIHAPGGSTIDSFMITPADCAQ